MFLFHQGNKIKAGLFFALWLLPALGTPAFSQSDDMVYGMRTDWTQSHGKTPVSAFVFNDVNESGDYDLGDRGMAEIVVGLSQNDAPITAIRGNAHGFSNFVASISVADVPLAKPGIYDFTVLIPPGWRLTTGNQTQTRELVYVAGSNAGLGLRDGMLEPIGLTRYKFIRGTYRGAEPATLTLHQNGKLIVEATLAPDEQFLWPVDPGDYDLRVNNLSRSVTVSENPVDVGQVGMIATATSTGRVIDFENGAANGLTKAPNGYGGLNWFNLNIVRSNLHPGSVGYVNGATSGVFVVYNSAGHPGEIYADNPFDFLSVNLTAAWPQSEGEQVVFAFYRDETLLFEDVIGLSAFGPITYQPNVQGVTRVALSSMHNWQMVIDDLTVNTTP